MRKFEETMIKNPALRRWMGIKALGLAFVVPVAATAIAGLVSLEAAASPATGDASNPSPAVQSDELAKQGTALAKKYCFQCHGGEQSKGDESFNVLDHQCLTEHASEYVIKGDLENSFLWMRIADGEMPPKKAPQPTADEIEIFKQWVSAGAPIDAAVASGQATNDTPSTSESGGRTGASAKIDLNPKPAATQPAPEPSTSAPPEMRAQPEPPAVQPKPPVARTNIQPASQPRVRQEAEPQVQVGDIAVEGVRVLSTKCGNCHPGNGNPDFDPADPNRMVQSPEKILVPGDPAASLIWQRAGIDQDMPPKGHVRKNPNAALSDQDRAILQQWIAAGAPYPTLQPRGQFIGKADVWDMCCADLESLHEHDRPYTRYFTFDNVYNNYTRYTENDYIAHHAALSKVCNSLSHESSIRPPHRVDPRGILWRIDLRDYGWDGLDYHGCGVTGYSAWNLLVAKYPYGLSYSENPNQRFRDNYRRAQQMTYTRMPILRGDWFIYRATQDELYYLIMQTPKTDYILEQQLGVDVRGDFMRQRLLRSAVVNSGVSVSNRLMDRHQCRDGYYWKSYDFAINAERNDLVQYPLGPVFHEHPWPDSAFLQDGGEMIYSLANGLQAYMLCDDKGNRINRGPATVVADDQNTSGTSEVANAISCMNCHANGMRNYSDDIRENIAVFGQQQQFVQQLFDPRNQLQSILKDDANSFRRASFRCYDGVVEEVPERFFRPVTEPVAVVAKGFWKELDADDVAYEIGMIPPDNDAEQLGFMLMGQARGNMRVQTLGLRPLINPNGKIRRETWDRLDGFESTSLYQEVCSEFNIAPGYSYVMSDSRKIFEAFDKHTLYDYSGYKDHYLLHPKERATYFK